MKKSLLYHIYPYGDDVALYENLTHLALAIRNFDYVTLKIASDEPTLITSPPLLKEFNTFLENANLTNINIAIYKNSPTLGETVGFIPELKRILYYNPNGITYIGTTAGVSRTGPVTVNIAAWVRSLYFLLLHDIPKIEATFKRGATSVGAYLKNTPMDKGGPRPSPWHYSGGQYWICNTTLLNNSNWPNIAMCRHGVEMYPGYMLPIQTAASMYDTSLDLYLQRLHPKDWISNL